MTLNGPHKTAVLYQLSTELHDYLSSKNQDVLFIPSCTWWQDEGQYGLIKRISKEDVSWSELRAYYLSIFIRTKYHIKKK